VLGGRRPHERWRGGAPLLIGSASPRLVELDEWRPEHDDRRHHEDMERTKAETLHN
jgi:hypothetical protein